MSCLIHQRHQQLTDSNLIQGCGLFLEQMFDYLVHSNMHHAIPRPHSDYLDKRSDKVSVNEAVVDFRYLLDNVKRLQSFASERNLFIVIICLHNMIRFCSTQIVYRALESLLHNRCHFRFVFNYSFFWILILT